MCIFHGINSIHTITTYASASYASYAEIDPIRIPNHESASYVSGHRTITIVVWKIRNLCHWTPVVLKGDGAPFESRFQVHRDSPWRPLRVWGSDWAHYRQTSWAPHGATLRNNSHNRLSREYKIEIPMNEIFRRILVLRINLYFQIKN